MTDYSGSGFGGTIDWNSAEVESRASLTPKSAIATWDSNGAPAQLTGSQGDVFYLGANGVVSKLSAGTTGQVLTTGGAGANPSWGNAQTLVFLGKHELSSSGANLTVSGLSTASYKFLKLLMRVKDTGATNRIASLTFNSDTSGNYDRIVTDNGGASSGSNAQTSVNLADYDNNEFTTIEILVSNIATANKLGRGIGLAVYDQTTPAILRTLGLIWHNTSNNISSVNIASNGTFDVGSGLYVWGLADA